MHEFTLRKALTIFGCVALGLLLLNVIDTYFEPVRTLHVLVTMILMSYLGCWISEPKVTLAIHKKVYCSIVKYTLPTLGFFYAAVILFSCLYLSLECAGLLNGWIREFVFKHIELSADNAFTLKWSLIACSFLTYGGCWCWLSSWSGSNDLDYKTLEKLESSNRLNVAYNCLLFLLLGVFAPIASIPVFLCFVLGFTALSGVLLFFFGRSLIELAARHETSSIIIGVSFGILVGAALGWTEMEFSRVSLQMGIGGFSGALFGWGIHELGLLSLRMRGEIQLAT